METRRRLIATSRRLFRHVELLASMEMALGGALERRKRGMAEEEDEEEEEGGGRR
jgi:hypothetical protein